MFKDLKVNMVTKNNSWGTQKTKDGNILKQKEIAIILLRSANLI